jgi:hypothetical protein
MVLPGGQCRPALTHLQILISGPDFLVFRFDVLDIHALNTLLVDRDRHSRRLPSARYVHLMLSLHDVAWHGMVVKLKIDRP